MEEGYWFHLNGAQCTSQDSLWELVHFYHTGFQNWTKVISLGWRLSFQLSHQDGFFLTAECYHIVWLNHDHFLAVVSGNTWECVWFYCKWLLKHPCGGSLCICNCIFERILEIKMSDQLIQLQWTFGPVCMLPPSTFVFRTCSAPLICSWEYTSWVVC